MDIIQSELKYSVRQFIKMESDLFFDLRVQRHDNVWNEKRKSLFIHTLMQRLPFPVVYAKKEGVRLDFLDGKQRLKTATLPFINDAFELSNDTPVVKHNGKEYEVAGLSFSELPQELKDAILDTNFTITALENITDDEIDEMFFRLNNGVALTNMETTRALAGTKITTFIEEITSEPFFSQSIAITKAGRNRFIDEEVILQIIAIIENDGKAVDLGGEAIKEFAQGLRKEGISKEAADTIVTTTHYLNEALPIYEKEFKKIHVPMIFVMATKAIEMEIAPSKFGGWVQDFFTRYKKINAYLAALTSGVAKKDKVQARLTAMMKDFDKHIANSPEYKAPEVRQTGKRGRKKKTTDVNENEQIGETA